MDIASDIDLVVNYLLACRNVLADRHKDGTLPIDKETYIRSVAKEFHYTTRGIIQTNFDSEFCSREIWSWREYQVVSPVGIPSVAGIRTMHRGLG